MRTRLTGIFVLLLALAAPRAATAGQIALAWDANKETNIAGYVVQWGTTAVPFVNSTDVGKTTTWTLTGLSDGVSYSFRVVAYNTLGEYSDPSATVSGTPSAAAPGGASLAVGRSALTYGVIRNGTSVLKQTTGQTVTVTQSGTTTPMNWTAVASQSWVLVSPASGSGNTTLTITINPALAPTSGNADATITVSSTAATNGPQPIAVHLVQKAPGTSTAPGGSFDTPADNTANVTGGIAVTGWALDDIEVVRVELWRDPTATETPAANGKVFVGNAIFVPGARPDVETISPSTPFNYRAGWGYLLLTNGLPDGVNPTGGNGSFRFYAYAIDAEGNQTLLGSKGITVTNASATAPFGTLDTPAQGETISGNAYVSFGWALSPHSTIPVNGSTIDVYIDGAAVGHPTYNIYRSDIATAFPGYANSGGAIGYSVINTTTLSNGLHTISWVARDAAGNTNGLGSRFFNVFNGGTTGSLQAAPPAAAVAELPDANEIIEVHRPVPSANASSFAVPEYTGRTTIHATEMEAIELRLAGRFSFAEPGRYEGFQVVGGELRALPPGSSLDADAGVFRWQPGPAFVGGYDLVFVRTGISGQQTKIPVHVDIR